MVTLVWVVGAVLVLQVPPPNSGASPATELRREARALREQETGQLKALAERLRARGDSAAVAEVLARVEPARPAGGATRFVPLPEVVPAPAKGLANVPARGPIDAAWRTELQATRSATARGLFALAERAATTTPKHYALADECLRAVLDREPDHPEARRLLGHVPLDGGWATPFAARNLRRKMVNHPTFGWVDPTWLPHLERGELPAPPVPGQRQVRWLSAAQADALHRPWESAWRIETEHFLIRANVPFSEAIAFGRQLETFHELFTALLADVIAPGNRLPLAHRIQDKAMVGERPIDPHLISYFATKQEYVNFLEPTEGPGIDQSLGIYIPPKPGQGKRVPAYFFRDPDGAIAATATLFHEVSHQLLFELAGPNAFDRNVGNYWVFEGLGTYFETVVTVPDGSLRVGGLVGPRIDVAKLRLIKQREFVPTERLVRLGRNEFNRDDLVHLHYAEAMALTIFLMQAEDESYREPFLDYVKDAYRGRLRRDTGRSLAERLDIPYKTLDAQLLEFLRGG